MPSFFKIALFFPVMALTFQFSKAQNGSWELISLPTQSHLREIEYIKNWGWIVVGDSGNVFVNQGPGWQKINVSGSPDFFSVEFLNYTLTTGKIFLLSTNNKPYRFRPDSLDVLQDTLPGWSEIPGTANQLVNLNITNTVEFRYGVPCDSGELFAYKTVWNPPTFHFQFKTQKGVQDLYPFNAWNILAIGDSGKIWRTVGLDNAFSQVSQNWSFQGLNRIFGKGNDLIWVAGNQGTMLFSSNGGTIWQAENLNTQENLLSGSALDTSAWVCGSNGTIYSSWDMGNTWNQENTGIFDDLLSIKAWGNEVYACGKNGTLIRLNRLTSSKSSLSGFKAGFLGGFWSQDSKKQVFFSGHYQLMTIEGRILKKQSFQEGETIELGNPASGVYLVQYHQKNGGSGVEKLIVTP